MKSVSDIMTSEWQLCLKAAFSQFGDRLLLFHHSFETALTWLVLVVPLAIFFFNVLLFQSENVVNKWLMPLWTSTIVVDAAGRKLSLVHLNRFYFGSSRHSVKKFGRVTFTLKSEILQAPWLQYSPVAVCNQRPLQKIEGQGERLFTETKKLDIHY